MLIGASRNPSMFISYKIKMQYCKELGIRRNEHQFLISTIVWVEAIYFEILKSLHLKYDLIHWPDEKSDKTAR